ncbi:unnamed protein product, partial [Owenia fusiformis]
ILTVLLMCLISNHRHRVLDVDLKPKHVHFNEHVAETKAKLRHTRIELANQHDDDNAGFGIREMKSIDVIQEIPTDIVLDQFQKNALFSFNSKDVNADILKMPELHFLLDMKNPCWLEPLTAVDPYARPLPYLMRRPHALDGVLQYNSKMFNNSKNPYRVRCLPYVYILGVQKCGTSDLYERLAMHPDFHPCVNKELHWWDNLPTAVMANLKTGRNKFQQFLSLDEYISYFDDAALRISETKETHGAAAEQMGITGEATPNTLYDNKNWREYPGNADRAEPKYLTPHFMHRIHSNAKFLITLRNPTARLYSGYLYFSDKPTLEQFHKWTTLVVKQFNKCVSEASERKCVHETYHPTNELQLLKLRLRTGLYVVDIEEWTSVFPKENFKVVTLEERNKDPIRQMKDIFAFLDMDPIDFATEELIRELHPVNVNKRKDATSLGPMLNSTKTILDEFYKPYNEQLAHLLNDPTFNWA